MPIEVIDRIVPKNGGAFAVVDAYDISMPDGSRLSEWSHPDVVYIVDTILLFALSDSSESPPTEGWTEMAPPWTEGQYLWQKTIVVYSDGTMKTSSLVCLSGSRGQDGEDATTLIIDSTQGTVFKNSAIATDLNVTIFKGTKQITTIAELKREYGAGAYLEWSWKRLTDASFGVILVTDTRISNDGFTFTITAGEVDTKVVLKCQLII